VRSGESSAQQEGGSAVLRVAEVIAIVQEWVDLHARTLPRFAGAYLWGGITALPDDAPFALYRDVDVVVVVMEGADDRTEEVLYRGVMLEVIMQNLAAHHDAHTVLADPSRGPNIATTQILADPTGVLVPLQRAVAEQYAQRRWIRARCEAEKEIARKQLVAMRAASDPVQGLDHVWGLLSALSGLLAVAQLGRPTTRRTMTLLGELLRAQGRPDLHEQALALLGSAHMSRADVQAWLHQSIVVFDRSVEVYRTPTPFGFTIQAHLRPYLAAATQEMIDEGYHREAMFWLIALASESFLVLQNDAPEAEKPGWAAQLRALHVALGYASPQMWTERVALAERLTEDIMLIADALAARQPE
jgi:hypothetical protein